MLGSSWNFIWWSKMIHSKELFKGSIRLYALYISYWVIFYSLFPTSFSDHLMVRRRRCLYLILTHSITQRVITCIHIVILPRPYLTYLYHQGSVHVSDNSWKWRPQWSRTGWWLWWWPWWWGLSHTQYSSYSALLSQTRLQYQYQPCYKVGNIDHS